MATHGAAPSSRIIPIAAAPSHAGATAGGACGGAEPLAASGPAPQLPPWPAWGSAPEWPLPQTEPVPDQLGRPFRALRVSVTDRCQFRCPYCMPEALYPRDHPGAPRADMLRFEEIEQVVAACTALGLEKVRITGGEPLLRKDLPDLIARLSALRTPGQQPLHVALTTNGQLLAAQAQPLWAAGLRRLTVSLDAWSEAGFRTLSGGQADREPVRAGIEAALRVGFAPIKLNMVVHRTLNAHEVLPLAQAVRDRWGPRATLRFIEYMDVGLAHGWTPEAVVPSAELHALLHRHWPLILQPRTQASETAQRWAYADGQGEVGFISSVSQAFCGDCDRARLSTDGRVFHCLFAAEGWDVRGPLRAGENTAQLAARFAHAWLRREDRYSARRRAEVGVPGTGQPMHYLGG